METEAKNIEMENLLEKIRRGEIQLPDFQRDWIWNDKQIKDLLESVIRGFPINSIMLLECDANNLRFARRPIEGAGTTDTLPQYLILDGQQRLTSLFGALFSDKPVIINRGKKEFYYYVDMAKAVESVKNSADGEGMVISVPKDKILRNGNKAALDLSSAEKEYAAGMFPLNKIFNSRKWLRAYERFCDDDAAGEFVDAFAENVIDKVSSYKIAFIQLEKNTPLEAVCKIFEKVNIGGKKLGVFDLLTAVFAARKNPDGNPIELRTDWGKIQNDFKNSEWKILHALGSSDFVTALTLLVSYEKFCEDNKKPVSCKSEDILKLEYDDYAECKDAVIDGFIEAAKFLKEEKISTEKFLPYKPQLIPMAALFARLKTTGKYNAASRNKIRQWYWCAVFSEAYRDGHLARFAKDIVQVSDWIDSEQVPDIVKNTQIVAGQLMNVSGIQSAAYKGLVALIFQHGARDFIAGSGVNFAESVEVHHIFPKRYCEARGFPKAKYDSIANKTLILKGTNKTIGGDPPSIYLSKIEQRTGLSSAEVDEILERHFIDAALCRADNFDAFFDDRAGKIFDKIEELTGREVVGRKRDA